MTGLRRLSLITALASAATDCHSRASSADNGRSALECDAYIREINRHIRHPGLRRKAPLVAERAKT
jgi:hypothetical protein